MVREARTLDAWAETMAAPRLDLTTALDEPDDDFAAPVPWRRLSADGRRVDVQVLESALTGRRLVVIEFDIGDDETERRILEAIGAAGDNAITAVMGATKVGPGHRSRGRDSC